MIDDQALVRSGGLDMTILRFSGELDSQQAATVRNAFVDLAGARCVVIDLAAVSFIDSAGLGALIGGIRKIQDQGAEAVIAGARPGVLRLLQITGVDRLARIEP